jgi:XrtN system VIT domain protein
MDKKKNKLKQLLSNQQDLFENGKEAWDLPDGEVWENARLHFPKYAQNALTMEERTHLSGTYKTGIIFLAITFLAFILSGMTAREEIIGYTFFGIYALFFIYFIINCRANKKEFQAYFAFKNLSHNILLALIGTVSAYALNRIIPVFHESTVWLSTFLMISNIALLWISYKKFDSPALLNSALAFVLGANFILQFYQTLYILPFMIYVPLSFWFFGFSLHALLPLWLLYLTGHITYSLIKKHRDVLYPFLSGLALPLFVIGHFTYQWVQVNQLITENWKLENTPKTETLLPNWTRVAQRVKPDFITKRILKSGWKYVIPKDYFTGGSFGFNGGKKEHDPIVFAAAAIGGKLDLEDKEKSLIYRSITNERHSSEQRLWSGDLLSTTNIVTNVQLMPEYRLAYTEKNLRIKNGLLEMKNNRGFTSLKNTQEAIYSFFLPEGSVVTSASLWIEGEERPAILTTKSKAENAYNTIVGRERRDPLLVTWQEGNRVTARIFPCSPKEERQFKLGITSPLRLEGENLVYENIDFQGPYFAEADERINIILEGQAVKPESNLNFDASNGGYVYDGAYKSDWDLSFPAPALSTQPFIFKNRAFSLNEYTPKLSEANLSEIYLDINQSWSKSDFYNLWQTIKDKKVYAWSGKLIELNEANKTDIFNQLSELKFSIFPFQKIQNPEQSLVISAYGANTPTLSELADNGGWHRWQRDFEEKNRTPFSRNLNAALQANEEGFKVFHLGAELNPYLKSLRELRSIQLEMGDVNELISLIKEQKFTADLEDESHIVLQEANLILQEEKTDLENSTETPDHLMRLFVYNDLMQEIGKNYFDSRSLQDSLIAAASEVTVLSPVSSFVTLETQEDYERFKIEKNKTGLQNASFDSAGSVPEPHEWMLIFLVSGFMLWMYKRND